MPSTTALAQTGSDTLKTFDFDDLAVRTVIRDGAPWFVAADVCRVLDIANTTQALTRLDDDEVTLCSNEGSYRPTNFVSESGLYALILTSRKPSAKRFRKWITSEVIPAIRKTGSYGTSAAAKEKPILVVERPDNRIGQLIDVTERLLRLAEDKIVLSKPKPAQQDALPAISAFIRRRRGELRLSQEDVARLAGITQTQVFMLESGRSTNPTLKTLQALCHALDCDMNALTGHAATDMIPNDEHPEDTIERLADQMADALDKLEDGRWFARVYPRSVEEQPFHLVSVKIYGRK